MVGLRRIDARHGWSRQNQPDRGKTGRQSSDSPGRIESPPERRKQQKGKIGGCGRPPLASAAAGCCLHASSPARDCISTLPLAPEGFFFEANIGCEMSSTVQFFLTRLRSCGKQRNYAVEMDFGEAQAGALS